MEAWEVGVVAPVKVLTPSLPFPGTCIYFSENISWRLSTLGCSSHCMGP